jgi:hypothetical protein
MERLNQAPFGLGLAVRLPIRQSVESQIQHLATMSSFLHDSWLGSGIIVSHLCLRVFTCPRTGLDDHKNQSSNQVRKPNVFRPLFPLPSHQLRPTSCKHCSGKIRLAASSYCVPLSKPEQRVATSGGTVTLPAFTKQP